MDGARDLLNSAEAASASQPAQALKDRVLSRLRPSDDDEARRWLASALWLPREAEGSLELLAPTIFHLRALEPHLARAAEAAAEAGYRFKSLTARAVPRSDRVPQLNLLAPTPAPKAEAEPRPLNPRHSFETFEFAPSNSLAAGALRDLASGPATLAARLSVLLLIAPGPWGKSHLLEALARALASEGRSFFRLDLTRAPAAESLGDFWRGRELIIIDDLPLLAGRPDLQARLTQAHDEAAAVGGLMVAASPVPAHQLSGLSEALRSRLGGGLSLPLERPEYETLLALARRRAGELALDLSPEALAPALRAAEGDPRRLGGYLETAAHIAQALAVDPAEALHRALPVGSGGPQGAELGIEAIVEAVAAAFGLKSGDLTGPSKVRSAVWPRRAAMLLARELTSLTTTEIGAALGGRDHSTVIHALQKVRRELENPARARLVENIKRSLLLKEWPQ